MWINFDNTKFEESLPYFELQEKQAHFLGEKLYYTKQKGRFEKQSADYQKWAETCIAIASLGWLITLLSIGASVLGYVSVNNAGFYHIVDSFLGASFIPSAMAVFYGMCHLKCEKQVLNCEKIIKSIIEQLKSLEILKFEQEKKWKLNEISGTHNMDTDQLWDQHSDSEVLIGRGSSFKQKSEAYKREAILVNQSANHKKRAKICAGIASLGFLITLSALVLGYVNGDSIFFYNLVGATVIPCAMAVLYAKRHLNCEKNIKILSKQLKMLEFTEISETLKSDADPLWDQLRLSVNID